MGGYGGYFADPDGFLWEVAYNPFWKFDRKVNVKIYSLFWGIQNDGQGFFGHIDGKYTDELLISDMDTIRDVAAHTDLLDAAYRKGYLTGKSDAVESPR